MGGISINNAVCLYHSLLEDILDCGDIAVDCTMGNGNDTLFLLRCVGEKGMVYSFDIQQRAIDNTRKLIGEKHRYQNYKLILDSHENIDKHIKERVKAVVFNLGYLPGGSHHITTVHDTTLKAVKKSMAILKQGGIIILCVYPGHPEGIIEKQTLLEYAKAIDSKNYSVLSLSFINQSKNSPFILVIQKKA
jgi:predicted methyltransferase